MAYLPPYERARPPKVAEIIAQSIVDYIVRTDLSPGERLAPEHEMLEEMRVGRATLREALRLLESRGVITVKPGAGGGAFVRRPRPEDLSEELTLIMQFEKGSIEEIVEARFEIECLAVERATFRLTASDLEELQASIEETRRQPGDPQLFIPATRRFHTIISDACGNLPLKIFSRTLHAITSVAVLSVPHNEERSLLVAEAHHKILQALLNRDVDEAVASMRNHLDTSLDFWTRHTGDLNTMLVHWIQLLSRGRPEE